MPGVFNGGDLIAHFDFADEDAYRDALPAIDAVLAGSGVVRFDGVDIDGAGLFFAVKESIGPFRLYRNAGMEHDDRPGRQ